MKKIDPENISAEVPVPSAIFYLQDSDSVLVVGTNNKERFGSDTFSTALVAKKIPLNSQPRRQLWFFDDDDNNEDKAIKDMWPQAARFDEQNQCVVAAAVQGTSYFGLSPSWNALVVSKFDKEGGQIGTRTIDFGSISSAYSSEVVGSNYFIHCQLNQFDGRYAVFQLDKNLNQIGLQYFGYRPSRQTNPELFGPEVDVTKATLADGSVLQLRGNSIDVLTQAPTQSPTELPTQQIRIPTANPSKLPTQLPTQKTDSPSIHPTQQSLTPTNEPILNTLAPNPISQSLKPSQNIFSSFRPSAIESRPPTIIDSSSSSNRSSQNLNAGEIFGISFGILTFVTTALYFFRKRFSQTSRTKVRNSDEEEISIELEENNPSAPPMESEEVGLKELEVNSKESPNSSKLEEMIKKADFLLKDKENFCCPISTELMTDPVLTTAGRSYQREAIEEWLKRNTTDPMTRASLRNTQVIPNLNLREEISEFATSTMIQSLDLAEKFFEIGDVEYGRKMLGRIEELKTKFPNVSQDFSEKFEQIKKSYPSTNFENLGVSSALITSQNDIGQSF